MADYTQATEVTLHKSNLAAREGNGVLHARLREVDEAAANRLHPNDNMRVVRAIEVAQFRLENSMENLLHSDDCERENDMEVPALEYSAFGLEMSREKLYARVDARVDAMLADGFLSELSTLIETGYGQSAPLQSLGYRQMRDALTDSSKLEEGVGIWKRQTRRYAKRQLTWFRHQLDVRWIAAEKPGGELRDAREFARQIADEFLGVVGKPSRKPAFVGARLASPISLLQRARLASPIHWK